MATRCRNTCSFHAAGKLFAGRPDDPGANQILTERHEAFAVGWGKRGRFVGIEPIDLEFEFTNCD